jgi:hypothetical protein
MNRVGVPNTWSEAISQLLRDALDLPEVLAGVRALIVPVFDDEGPDVPPRT